MKTIRNFLHTPGTISSILDAAIKGGIDQADNLGISRGAIAAGVLFDGEFHIKAISIRKGRNLPEYCKNLDEENEHVADAVKIATRRLLTVGETTDIESIPLAHVEVFSAPGYCAKAFGTRALDIDGKASEAAYAELQRLLATCEQPCKLVVDEPIR